MSEAFHFITLDVVASLAGLTNRAVEQAVSRVRCGKTATWRGASLVVREIPGRGGRGGMRYQVRVDSLPADLRTRFEQLSKEPCGLISHSPKAQREREDWYHVIKPLLDIDDPLQRSVTRAAVFKEIAAKEHRIDGKTRKVDERTIRRKYEAYKKHGLAGLSKDKRSDAGKLRIIVTRLWDVSVPFDDAMKETVAEKLRDYIRGILAGGESIRHTQTHAARELQCLTTMRAFDPGTEELKRICCIPRYMIERESQYRKIYRYKRDRKAYDDAKPRVRRSRNGYQPMDVIVGDVHPVDILCLRSDGSEATARAIAWLDIATNRMWMTIILLEKGEGIRNAHVIDSFLEMIAEWGLPRQLYIDNGKEYNFAEFANDAMKLNESLTDGRRIECHYQDAKTRNGKASNVTRAKPYNAAAKPIEGIFAVLERGFLRPVDGWIGGNRMDKKTGSPNRKAMPFPGSFESLQVIVAEQLRFYNQTCQHGETLKGISPDEAWARAIGEGWQPVQIDETALLLAFSKEEPRTVRQGAIRCNGEYWTSDKLRAYQGDKVSVLIPKYHHWNKLPVRDEKGAFLCVAEPQTRWAFTDPRGATEAAQFQREHKQGLNELRRQAPKLDVLEERRKLLADMTHVPLPTPAARIGGSDEVKQIVAHIREPEDVRHVREQKKLKESNRERSRLAAIVSRNGTRG